MAPGQDRFRGHISIKVEILHATPTIWLNSRFLQLETGTIRVRKIVTPVRIRASDSDFVQVIVGQNLRPGTAHLEIDYTGEISRTLTDGAFQQRQGNDWYIFTKLEPIAARRVFPCFDEPAYKVPWQLTLRFPKGLKAYSNSAIDSLGEADGLTQAVFKQTPPLPSYLLAFAVGPFDEISTAPVGINKVPSRIIVPRGRTSEASYVASVIPQLVALMERYFGRPYPYMKLDQVVVPFTAGWGAMENAGLIMYGDFLLSSPQQDTDLAQRSRTERIAHELAHQWFGNLVTITWWDDLWLNEAFASWMERKLLDDWKPDWNLKRDAAQADNIFRADSLITARKIHQHIATASDIAAAFDTITYGKGEAIIGMFENYIGGQKFQRAIREYLSEHEWGNASSSSLLAALDRVAPGSGAAFGTFLNQAGYPIISVEQGCITSRGKRDFARLHIKQERFAPLRVSLQHSRPWHVPVCISWSDGMSIYRQCNLLRSTSTWLILRASRGCPNWLFLDSGADGYYVVSYQDQIAESLNRYGLGELSPIERTALLRNSELLLSSGRGNPEQELGFVNQSAEQSDLSVVRQSAQIVKSLSPFVPSSSRLNYAKWLDKLYGARARELGWVPKENETQETKLLRMRLVPLVSTLGQDRRLREEAVHLANQWLTTKSGIDQGLILQVLHSAAWAGERSYFNSLVMALKQDHVQRERQWIIEALTAFQKPELARAKLQLLLESDIDVRELAGIPFDTSDDTRQIAWDFVKVHFDRLNSLVPSIRGVSYGAYLPEVAAGFCDNEHREDVERFFKTRLASLPGADRHLASVVEKISVCAAQAEMLGPVISDFLARR